jgi:nitroreductase
MSPEEQASRIAGYVEKMEKRRSVRAFSSRPVSEKVIRQVIHSAGTSPSGANQQPWTFVLIKDPALKRSIRIAAEEEERKQLQEGSLPNLDQRSLLGDKGYLEEAPFLVAMFKINHGLDVQPDGTAKKIKHYYVPESIGIAAGFFLAALQHAGLDSLVHTPVAAAQQLLERPKNESPYLLFAVGYAKQDYEAPSLTRKSGSAITIGESPFTDDSYEAPEYQPSASFTDEESQLAAAASYYDFIKKRRNVRHYSTEEADVDLIHQAIRAAAATPSGGNLQPYRFAIISDPERKGKIRELAEIEEKKLYEERISDEWREVLAPLGTNWEKAHLTDAPHLIVAFKVDEAPTAADIIDQSLLNPRNNFALESVSMAVGVLMGGLHHAGLCTLTHTPSPMYFLRDYLNRPKNEVPILVLPVGYPADDCEVPDITKKLLSEILVNY